MYRPVPVMNTIGQAGPHFSHVVSARVQLTYTRATVDWIREGLRKANSLAKAEEIRRKHSFSNFCAGKRGRRFVEIAKATDWQNHSIRGFVSGHVTKKLGLKVGSTKSETGERTYRII